MDKTKVIPIDHGNRNIKTINFTFPASYVESKHLPSIGGDILIRQDKEYVFVDMRMPQQNDKTIDESYFNLTLAAIGKELANDMNTLQCSSSGKCLDIVILAGLPPLHYKTMASRYLNYYKGSGEQIDFVFNNISFSIRIKDVYMYPQAFAAALTVRDKVKNLSSIYEE